MDHERRHDNRRAYDKDEIIAATLEALDRRRHDDVEEQEIRAFIKLLMERERRSVDRIRKFQLSFIGAVAVTIVGFLAFIGQFVFDHILKLPTR